MSKVYADKDGQYKRKDSVFRDFISSKPGSKFPPEANRYHLYVSLACPWAHRIMITRLLKGLTSIIGLSVVHWHMDTEGWRFLADGEECEAATIDHLYGVKRLSELYFKANPNYEGRYTVPVLWDTKTETIVNNESSELLRMLNTEFNHLIDPKYSKIDLYPSAFRTEIDALNDWIYPNINNGVYKSGFATKQEPYEKEVTALFEHLNKVEQILKEKHEAGEEFIVGNTLTEVDIRLYTTIVRFDPVYHQHFKCNLGMIRHDFPNLNKWMKNLYWNYEAFKSTTDFDHIKFHYTKSHSQINPFGITPLGPIPNIMEL
ncbi:hypothetical protein CANARDRAFT_5809 [[Candida] arabinofermentans NRRL YB-2248]|uniref:Glutathione S-transferase omega-like 2 n=1 Tax=[Candida] arabinofermentans NRRL YB-2248 TaxID=983967 RepID=A0A1E4T676_9ASCO|nr:hypothetical protein CANARDRAFT_5809 [[Candida] arabinofermentans NRRL YB-2248]